VLVSRLVDTGLPVSIPLNSLKWGNTFITPTTNIIGPQYITDHALLQGSCGSPVLVRLTQKDRVVLAGMHLAGPTAGTLEASEFSPSSECTGLAQSMTLDLIDEIKKKFIGFKPLSHKESDLGSKTQTITLQALHCKSPINYIEKGVCNVYGSLDMPRSHMVSRVGPHFLRNYFLDQGYTISEFAPNMRSWIPWRTALLGYTKPVNTVNSEMLTKAEDGYFNDIISELHEDVLSDFLHPVSMEVAINGYPGIAFVDSINRSTSAGHPFRCPKTKLMVPCESNEIFLDPVDFNEEVYDRLRP
jgi:hypothetical protein